MVLDDIDQSDLEGPKIDRRTSLKLLTAAGITPAVAGCFGSEDTGSNGESGNGESGNGESGNGESSEDEDGSDSTQGGTLQVGVVADDLLNIHPLLRTAGREIQFLHNVCNALLTLNPNNEIVGDVATDWNIVDDTTYDFTIRDDVTFHNGNDVTAEDVRYSIELLGETEESSQTGLVEDVESVEVHNDTELTINLTSPIAPFPAFLTLRGMVSTLVSKEAHEEMGLEEYNNQPVGTGAFEIVDRTAGESISLEAHDDYFRTDEDGNQLPYFDELVVNFIPEPSTAWAAVQSGEVHFIDDLTTQLVDQAEQTDGISVVGTSPGQYYAVSHLCNNPQDYPDMAVAAGYHNTPEEFPDWSDRDLPTSDPRVREAISKAINRQEIVDRALLGYGTPAHSLWTPTTPMMYEEEPDPGQYQDQEAARELLDEAGYTGDPRMEVDFVVHRNTERMGTVLQEQLSQVGIDVNLNIQDESNYWPEMYSYTHEISLTNSIYDFDPWHSIYRQLGIPDGSLKGVWQKGLYIDEEFDELLQESYTTPQTEERKGILEDAIEIFHEDHPYSMVAFPEIIRAMSSDLSGVEMQLGFTKFHKASLQ